MFIISIIIVLKVVKIIYMPLFFDQKRTYGLTQTLRCTQNIITSKLYISMRSLNEKRKN